MRRPLMSTAYAPMCCVIPPASRSATRVFPDGVQQGGFPVVDVSHDGDDGRPRDEVFVPGLQGLDLAQFLFE